MEQTYDNIEYIFVNDASTDDSISILQEILKQYPNRLPSVKILHNDRNHGLAYTRRKSIEAATGMYITCVDSDDYINTDMVELLLKKAIEDKADLVLCGVQDEFENQHHNFVRPAYAATPTDDCLQLALNDEIFAIWGKLFVASLFKEGFSCYAPQGLDYLEDRYTLFFVATKVRRMTHISPCSYHYVHRPNSITAGKNSYHFDCLIRYWDAVDKYLQANPQQATKDETIHFLKTADKASLMLKCSSIQVIKKYADLYYSEERQTMHKLRRGMWLMAHLVHYHLWGLLYLYQLYINIYKKAINALH